MDEFTFGDILRGEKTNHPIVFLGQKNSEQFYGCIVTHAGRRYRNNFPFLEQHFETTDSNGKKFTVKYDNSYFAKLKLIKKNEWGPYKKVGMLTKDGKAVIQNTLERESPTTWKRYIDLLRSKGKAKKK